MNLNTATSENFFLANENSTFEIKFSAGMTISTAVLISFLTFSAFLGNAFVMLSFIVDKRLRNQSNFLLLNLAICDFFIGTFIFPLYVSYMLIGKWMLGGFLCMLWLTFDYTLCAASVFNVVLISCDRFISVTKPVLYLTLQKNNTLTFLIMSAVWIFAFLLYGPAIIFWKKYSTGNNDPEYSCVVGFSETWYFHFGTSCVDFILPLISISFFNLSIYYNIKKRSRKKKLNSVLQHFNENKKCEKLSIIASDIVLSSSQSHGMKDHRSPAERKIVISLKKCFSTRNNFSPTNNGRAEHIKIHVINVSRNEKIAKSLSILVCTFIICWAPYNILVSVRAACSGYCIDSYWYDITLWISYANSSINPVLYPLCHKSFRKAFKLILNNCQRALNMYIADSAQ